MESLIMLSKKLRPSKSSEELNLVQEVSVRSSVAGPIDSVRPFLPSRCRRTCPILPLLDTKHRCGLQL
jgi:hypothetical protein